MPEIGPEIPRVEELVGEMVGEEEHKADRYGRRSPSRSWSPR